jgi:ankyrin repeat protein
MHTHSRLHWVIVAAFVLVCDKTCAEDPQATTADVDPGNQSRQILQDKCIDCHDAKLQMADLRLDSLEAMIDGDVITPGDAANSLLLQRLEDRDLGVLMPPTGKLDPSEIEVLTKWVDAGASWPQGATLANTSSNAKEDLRAQALFSLIRSNDAGAIREMLRDESLVRVSDQHGASPLMHAALYANVKIVRLLLDRGAEPNSADEDGMTPLMYAVGGDVAKVQLLLDRGADANDQSKLGRSPLLMASAYAGNRDVVQSLLDAGADIHFADKRGWTSVVLAARTGDRELVQTLLEAGGDVNGGDSKRLSPGTPLMQAAWASEVELAAMLLEQGADQDQRSLDTALIFAATHGSPELVKLLLDAGSDPQANVVTNYVPESPILAAAYSDSLNSEIARMLLDRDVDLVKKDKRGETPLSLASARGPSKIVKLLGPSVADDVASDEVLDAAPTDDVGEDRIKQLVQKSVTLLQSCNARFFASSGCVACHQQTMSALLARTARERGLTVDETGFRQQTKLTSVDLGKKRVGFHQRIKIGGASHRIAYLLWGLAAADYPADEITDAAYVELAGLQLSNGCWVSDAHRPPTEYSPVTATAVALRAIQQYAPPGLRQRTSARVSRATEWLVDARATANAEQAFRLLGLHWGGAEATHIEQARDELLRDQTRSGGWSQLPTLAPDAYATGLTLYALAESESLSVSDPAYRRGVEYLMKTAEEDGSWHVRSRSFKFQPYFESGFPHGHDQWISAAATGWAAMALLQTIEPVD